MNKRLCVIEIDLLIEIVLEANLLDEDMDPIEITNDWINAYLENQSELNLGYVERSVPDHHLIDTLDDGSLKSFMNEMNHIMDEIPNCSDLKRELYHSIVNNELVIYY